MHTVRGKFKVTEITRNAGWEGAAIKLEAQYSQNGEDNSFSKATPWAELRMTVTAPNALATLALGRSFYVDFIPID